LVSDPKDIVKEQKVKKDQGEGFQFNENRNSTERDTERAMSTIFDENDSQYMDEPLKNRQKRPC
jgi:hypothetical protein